MLIETKPQKILIPPGTHIARCIELIHIGTYDSTWQGKPKVVNKISLTFEFPELLHKFGDEEKPMVHSQKYSFSMKSEMSSLRKLVEGIIGTSLTDTEAMAWDREQLVGMPCLLTISQKTQPDGSKFNVITAGSPLMKGQVCKAPRNSYKILTYEKWDQDRFDSLPPFLKEIMMKTVEYKKLKGIAADVKADDVPF